MNLQPGLVLNSLTTCVIDRLSETKNDRGCFALKVFSLHINVKYRFYLGWRPYINQLTVNHADYIAFRLFYYYSCKYRNLNWLHDWNLNVNKLDYIYTPSKDFHTFNSVPAQEIQLSLSILDDDMIDRQRKSSYSV